MSQVRMLCFQVCISENDKSFNGLTANPNFIIGNYEIMRGII